MNSTNINKTVIQTIERDFMDITNLFTLSGSASYNPITKIARLTENQNYQAGAISGNSAISVKENFMLEAEVFLGDKENGADGIAVGFHSDKIGKIGKNGGGLGVLGLKNGIAFEMDTYTDAPEDNDPNFGHNQIKTAHAGFVSTDASSKYLTALAPMQTINKPNGLWRTLKIHWDAQEKTLTANLEGKIWELKNPNFDPNQKYTFVIGSATGAVSNTHEIRITQFNAHFTKPKIEANDVEINVGDSFDPLHHRAINLKATDEEDGDLTNKITVESTNVDITKPGNYKVTYKVVNSYGEFDFKTITVTVVDGPIIDETWDPSSSTGWKDFAGGIVETIKDPENAYVGNYVFDAKAFGSIYNQIKLEANTKYKMTVMVKSKETNLANHIFKISLKADPSSTDSRDIYNDRLNNTPEVDKGYREVSTEFTTNSDEENPLFVIQTFSDAYIGSIKLVKINN
ncbi:DUF5011 domain-containing protein [Bacillus cereus]|nr:DUF5011 domain-containing protein [Bacillus cereus]PGU63283.1 DUF5011 domain-containing protein [Bacillus cereus]